MIGARFIRDVDPGELVVVNSSGTRAFSGRSRRHSPRPCIFDVYFSRPDSIVDGDLSVYEVRKGIGAELARGRQSRPSLVVPVPDSGVPAALGFIRIGHSVRAGHYPLALCRPDLHPAEPGSPPPGREAEAQRQFRAHPRQAHRAHRRFDRARPTSVKIVQMVREAGAREVHMRIASPPRTAASTASTLRSGRSSSPRR